MYFACSFRRKKAADSPEPRLFAKTKKPRPCWARGSHPFLVNPSKTPSSSPSAYEYYDAKYEKQAVRQRMMDHDNFLPN
jgi:hypothetical protein